jgi:sucrose-6-phosphate hydrolase SacC (GH32 family)
MHYRYWRGEVRSLRIFIDRSSVEIFINDGEGVMSSRYFPDYPAQLIFSGHAGCILLLAAANMHGRISVLLSGSWRNENQTRNH